MNNSLLRALKILAFLALTISLVILSQEVARSLFNNKYLSHISRELLSFTFTLFVFYVFIKYWDKINLKRSVLFPDTRKDKFFIIGSIIGLIMILSTYLISGFSGVIKIEVIESDKAIIAVTVVTSLFAMLFTAFWEELVFRGYVLANLEKITGKHAACIIVALAFGLLHLLSPIKSWQIVLSTFLSGLLLNYAFVITRNLYFPIGIHFMWNFLNSVLYSKYIFKVTYIDEFWGGIKNPEEGMIAIIITLAAFLFVFLSSGRVVKWVYLDPFK